MKSKEFLIKKLKELASKFEDIKIRYEYHQSTYSHLIEVIPLSIFENDKAYMLAEEKLENDFENLFPDEDIVFISEDSLTEIKNPELLLGYEEVIFNNTVTVPEFMVEGFTEEIDFSDFTNYALAA